MLLNDNICINRAKTAYMANFDCLFGSWPMIISPLKRAIACIMDSVGIASGLVECVVEYW
jgi:hypothetical protein